MGGHHDLGGHPAGPVERVEAPPNHWQKRMEAMRDCLAHRRPPAMHVDEMRRGIEELPADEYARLDPYQRKTVAIRNVLLGKGVLDRAELEAAIAWLWREKEKDLEAARQLPEHGPHRGQAPHSEAQHHDHDHDHDFTDHNEEPVPGATDCIDEHELISEAMIQGLVARGLLLPGELRAGIERAEMAGPALGADIVARAWADPAFKARLLADGKGAMAGLGIEALEAQIVVVENTRAEHNLVVCTLCSCYPRSILGSPPAWYVGKAYRARAVREPRKVLAEFGLVLGDEVRVRVHDSTANMRYLVLPMRPEGTDRWPEERLKRLVTRDSMIGVARALEPGELGAAA
ncbi:MAG TPA: nitrile hydratase subunit alpha [Usitatibacter sp.]|nr:nitrile hydratase subunit alpha [Usitatibacter sp.]